MIKWEETREIIFCEQQILKNMKTIFYEKKSFLRSKDVEIRVQIFFFSEFREIYFCERLDLKNFAGLIFANLQNNIFWNSFSRIWPKFAKIAKVSTAKASTIEVMTFQNYVL